MSVIERLQTMEAPWDSLLDEESEIESPRWRQDILEEKKKDRKRRSRIHLAWGVVV